MNPQPDLWSQPRSRRTDPPTSHAAAQSMKRTASLQREQIVHALRAYGPQTHDRIDHLLNWPTPTAARRLKELVDTGRIRKCGPVESPLTAPTISGRQAVLYEAI